MHDLQKISDEQLLLELQKRLCPSIKASCEDYKKQEEEIRLLSAQVREAEKDKSTFLSNVRNEINNPLTSILGLAAAVTCVSSEEKVRRLGSLIHQQAFQLDFQMRNIIITSEIETGDVRPLPSKVNIRSLIESQVEQLRLATIQASVQVDIQVSDELSFSTDPYLFQIICSNLFANAIEYSGTTRLVKIRAWKSMDNLFISVIDYGEGIAPEKQNQLFKRFKQLDSGSTKLHQGQGLGLAIVYELVSILGGVIDLKSSARIGTTITLQLPLLEDNEASTASAFGNEILFAAGDDF